MDKNDDSDKKVKRIKTRHVRTVTPSVPSTPIPSVPVNVDYFRLEDEESKLQGAEEGIDQYLSIVRGIGVIIRKTSEDHDNPELVHKYVTDVCVSIMKMRKLNRLDKHRSKRSRDTVNDRKKRVDSLNLQHQNLLYEANHLQREVTKNLGFKSLDEDVELVPLKQFYDEAPKVLTKFRRDPHELHLSRLRWEYEQRKNYAKMLKKLEFLKEKSKKDTKEIERILKSIYPTLQTLLETCEPLEKHLGMDMNMSMFKEEVAMLYPRPLYTFYVSVCAHKVGSDCKTAISFEGNVDDAKVFESKDNGIAEDSGDSDQEENVAKRHRHSTASHSTQPRKNIFDAFPLSLNLTIDSDGNTLSLGLFYLVQLKIVTVKVQSLLPPPKVAFCKEVLDFSTILNCLLAEDDDGKMSPNLANKYLLRDEYNNATFSNEGTGLPYHWVQLASGLHFIKGQQSDSEECILSNKEFNFYLENVIFSIKERIVSRLSLNEQLYALEQGGAKIFSDVSHMYPANVLSQLKKFSLASWADVEKHPKYNKMMERNLIVKESMVFSAVVERGSAVLNALVCIAHNYPIRKPVFLMFLNWNGSFTSASSLALRELEIEVNIHCIESHQGDKNEILMRQMRHLVMCFDIFIETNPMLESVEGPCEFSREKVVTRLYRGRQHSRPYTFLASKGIFTHGEYSKKA